MCKQTIDNLSRPHKAATKISSGNSSKESEELDIKYDKIGKGYDRTRRADGYLGDRILSLLDPLNEGHYLDIGCGTGNYTILLQQKEFHFTGIEPSEEMLSEAWNKNGRVVWKTGTAESTGMSEGSVNGIMAILTIHHWTDLTAGFSEMYRILKPDGRMVIFTATPEQMKGFWLNHYFPEMMQQSIEKMPTYQKLTEAISAAGLVIHGTEEYFIRPDLEDHFLFCGKSRPELYLDQDIRAGISSFAQAWNRDKIVRGLSELQSDIASGKIDSIISEYDNTMGDYLFITAMK